MSCPAICCPSCDWIGPTYSATSLTEDDARQLEPGSPVPHGRCPECSALIPFTAQPKNQYDWDDDRAERGNLTQYQRNCLLVLLARLVPDHPGFQASNEIAVALRSTIGSEIPIPDDRAPPFNRLMMAPYMQSWVYPLLVGALYGEPFHGHRRYVADDAASARNKVKASKAAKESDPA